MRKTALPQCSTRARRARRELCACACCKHRSHSTSLRDQNASCVVGSGQVVNGLRNRARTWHQRRAIMFVITPPLFKQHLASSSETSRPQGGVVWGWFDESGPSHALWLKVLQTRARDTQFASPSRAWLRRSHVSSQDLQPPNPPVALDSDPSSDEVFGTLTSIHWPAPRGRRT